MQSLKPFLLISTRLCHDLAGPISAMAAGASLLEEDVQNGGAADPSTVGLLADSAQMAALRLRLLRIVLGHIYTQLPPARDIMQLAEAFFEQSKKKLLVDPNDVATLDGLEPERLRLLVVTTLMGLDIWPMCQAFCLRRSAPGTWDLHAENSLTAAGAMWDRVLLGHMDALEPRTILGWFAGRLAKEAGDHLQFLDASLGTVRLTFAKS